MAKGGFYAMFRTKADMERHDELVRAEARRFATVWTADRFTMALGRKGFEEDDFRELDKLLTDVDDEYRQDMRNDLKDDPEMIYSRSLMERELKQWTGSLYVPPEERY